MTKTSPPFAADVIYGLKTAKPLTRNIYSFHKLIVARKGMVRWIA